MDEWDAEPAGSDDVPGPDVCLEEEPSQSLLEVGRPSSPVQPLPASLSCSTVVDHDTAGQVRDEAQINMSILRAHEDEAAEFDREALDKEGLALMVPPDSHEPGPPPDTTEDVVDLRSAVHSSLATMRFSQWVRISVPLYQDMRRAYVAGYGDCGIIAPYAAHHEHHRMREYMGDGVIRSERDADIAWLAEASNVRRYEEQKKMGYTVEELRSILEPMRSWVQPESLWIYANRHALNVYVCTLTVYNVVDAMEKRSSFDFRLITPQLARGAVEPISADHANTIAIYFHCVTSTYTKEKRQQDERQHRAAATGHYEYLVHAKTHRSCWRTDEDVVVRILQPALQQAQRIRHLNHYTEAMERQANAAHARRLPDIAPNDLAMWMVPDHFRQKSEYSRQLDGQLRNMLVRIVQVDPLQQIKKKTVARFIVLSYSGVVKEWIDHGELRMVAQDVDTELRQRQVTDEMLHPKNRVPLMTAWNAYLQRIRRYKADCRQRYLAAERERRQAAGQSHTQFGSPEVSRDQLPSLSSPPAAISTSDAAMEVDTAGVNPSAAADTLFSPLQTRSQRHAAAAAKAGAEIVKCCVCFEDVLPVGSEITCAGACQQTMHGLKSLCIYEYVPVGQGLYCCSSRCARPLLRQ